MTAIVRDTTEHVQGHTDTASSNVRGWAVFQIIGGTVACLTPLWPIGLCIIGVGLFFVPATYAVEPVEVAAVEAAKESGGGCGWLLLAMLMIVAFGFLGLVALGGVGSILGGL